jgi:Bacterial PH domain
VSSAQQQPGPASSRRLTNGHTQGVPGKFGSYRRPDGKPEMYRSPVAPLMWWVWVVFAAANLIDLAVQGRNHFAAMIAVILVLITGVTYVAAFRPRVFADDEGMTIINPLRDWRVPWNCVEGVALGDSLEVHCNWQDDSAAGSNGAAKAGNRRKRLYGWAVHSPRRSRLKAELRAQRQASSAERKHSASYSRLPQEAKDAMTKTDAEHIVRSLEDRANTARAAGIADRGPVGTWNWLAVAALAGPALLVIVVALI